MVDGLQKIGPIVSAAAANNMPALAPTGPDEHVRPGALLRLCPRQGIKPLVGADFWVQSDELGDEQFRLTLLAMDNDGYQNITLLISRGYQRGHVQGAPSSTRPGLANMPRGDRPSRRARGDGASSCSRATARWWSIASPSTSTTSPTPTTWSCCVPVARTRRSHLHMAVALATEFEVPVVATNEVVFPGADDFDAHEIRVAIHDGYTLMDKRRPRRYSPSSTCAVQEEMCGAVCRHPGSPGEHGGDRQALQRDGAPGRVLPAQLPHRRHDYRRLPGHEVEGRAGGVARLPVPGSGGAGRGRPEYDERLDIELKVINQMGFPGYFLIVMEFIQWSKDNGIPVGPGRGSGQGRWWPTPSRSPIWIRWNLTCCSNVS